MHRHTPRTRGNSRRNPGVAHGSPTARQRVAASGIYRPFHLDGSVERLVANNEDAWVDDWEITNGAAGYNGVSRHIVYAGGCENNKALTPADTRTPQQLEALKRYVLAFHARHPRVKIVGHRDLPGVHKACPSFDVPAWLKSIGIVQ